MIDHLRHVSPFGTYLSATASVVFAHLAAWVSWEHVAVLASVVAAVAAATQAGVQVYDRIKGAK